MSSKALMGAGILAVAAVVGTTIVWAMFMHTETVEPGFHGVIVDKPYFWGNEGVRTDEVLKDGRKLLWRTSSLQPVRMTPQTVPVKFDDLSSADNILLDFEAGIQYQFTDAISLVRNFGVNNWFTANIEQPFRQIVREAVKKKTMTEMMSNVQAATEVDQEITAALQKLVVELKLPLRIVNISLGRAKPNENVLAQMNETAAQQQRQKTLIAATAAEGDREKEQIAKAKADNAYRNAMGLSPDMFIQLERIKRFADACREAKGTCIVDATGSANVMVK